MLIEIAMILSDAIGEIISNDDKTQENLRLLRERLKELIDKESNNVK